MTSKDAGVGGSTPDAEAISTAQALTVSLNSLADKVSDLNVQVAEQNAQVAEQKRYGRWNRLMIWSLAALTVVVAVVAVRAQQAHDSAAQVHASQISICQSTNTARSQNLQLWEYVLSLPPDRPLTEQQQKIRNEFRAYIQKVFAPRNCSKI